MIASPSVWGQRRLIFVLSAIAHVLGLAVGSIAMGLLVHTLSAVIGRPPTGYFAIPAALGLLMSAGIVRIGTAGSRWRVPRSWTRFGQISYGWLFGVGLGTGMVTALSSPACYVWLTWCYLAPSWSLVWPACALYALGRAVPFLAISVHAVRRRMHPLPAIERGESLVAQLAGVEVLALAAMLVVAVQRW